MDAAGASSEEQNITFSQSQGTGPLLATLRSDRKNVADVWTDKEGTVYVLVVLDFHAAVDAADKAAAAAAVGPRSPAQKRLADQLRAQASQAVDEAMKE